MTSGEAINNPFSRLCIWMIEIKIGPINDRPGSALNITGADVYLESVVPEVKP